MNREAALARLSDRGEFWDVLVIGGGATGLGVAVDAAARGYRTALVEQHDFAKGTSSRSTKLVHGGVRYLRRGEIRLVRESLRERGFLERNAPHLVRRMPFIVPAYSVMDLATYGFGLKAYDALAGKLSFGPSRFLSAEKTRQLLPNLKSAGLRGGVRYFDGQFDDARLALTLAQTADKLGAAVVNYTRVERLLKTNGHRVEGAEVLDVETGRNFEIRARSVINATGIFSDTVRRLDDASAKTMLAVSSGVHLVLDRSFLAGDHALMIPNTADGRVLFAIPWHAKVLVGTTDEARDTPELEPFARESEIAFLLEHISKYLSKPVTRADVRSVFAGLRPLVKTDRSGSTAKLSRDYAIEVAPSGLVTIAGGKWTNYRRMAEDTVNRIVSVARLGERPPATQDLLLYGAPSPSHALGETGAISRFPLHGSDASALEALIASEPELDRLVHGRLPYRAVEVVWAARHEMARTVEDILARRTRALVLDARAALESAPFIAMLLARELGKTNTWAEDQLSQFVGIARKYLL